MSGSFAGHLYIWSVKDGTLVKSYQVTLSSSKQPYHNLNLRVRVRLPGRSPNPRPTATLDLIQQYDLMKYDMISDTYTNTDGADPCRPYGTLFHTVHPDSCLLYHTRSVHTTGFFSRRKVLNPGVSFGSSRIRMSMSMSMSSVMTFNVAKTADTGSFMYHVSCIIITRARCINHNPEQLAPRRSSCMLT